MVNILKENTRGEISSSLLTRLRSRRRKRRKLFCILCRGRGVYHRGIASTIVPHVEIRVNEIKSLSVTHRLLATPRESRLSSDKSEKLPAPSKRRVWKLCYATWGNSIRISAHIRRMESEVFFFFSLFERELFDRRVHQFIGNSNWKRGLSIILQNLLSPDKSDIRLSQISLTLYTE